MNFAENFKKQPNPRYEYSISKILERVNLLKSLTAPFGLIVRYAVKANPHPKILKIIYKSGLAFDTSSGYEAKLLLDLNIPGKLISLSSQEFPKNIESLISSGVLFVATSLNQLDKFLSLKTGRETLGVRLNPDIGRGENNKTSTAGKTSGFGIWYEYADEVIKRCKKNKVKINRLHFHIGSGVSPDMWDSVMDKILDIVSIFPDVTALDMGGGFKVKRFSREKETNIKKVIGIFGKKLINFQKKTGRKITLEIEPGTFLIAHAGTLVATVEDIVDTGRNGFTFIRLNTGMNDLLRPTMYGAHHRIEVINKSKQKKRYVVIGHNCESGDIFTPVYGNPEEIETRLLNKANIGDEVRIYDVGAYGAAMRARNYNSFPDAPEIFVD